MGAWESGMASVPAGRKCRVGSDQFRPMGASCAGKTLTDSHNLSPCHGSIACMEPIIEPPPVPATPADRIRQRIEQSGLSVDEVAARSGIRNLKSLLDDPETILTTDVDVPLARVLGCRPEDLG